MYASIIWLDRDSEKRLMMISSPLEINARGRKRRAIRQRELVTFRFPPQVVRQVKEKRLEEENKGHPLVIGVVYDGVVFASWSNARMR